MQNLPITQVIPQIKEQLSKNPNVILQAPPGAGKTTALPLALLNETWLQNRQIIMLDPTTPLPSKKKLPFLVHRKLLHILKHEEGNILVFLAGVREIKKVEQLLRSTLSNKTYISTLYGNLSKEAQDKAIKAPPKGRRKIVLATNIAQTSLTIEGIKIVLDSGLHNVSVFNPFSGMNKLESQFISQDSATQRAGRAGRLSAGKAYHLWHKSKILLKHDTPEILSADLSQLLLELALWGNENMEKLSWMDLPPSTSIAHAKKLLTQLGALDKQQRITPHGKAMSSYPMHPRLAHMMLKAKALNLSYEASLLAVLIAEKDIYKNTFSKNTFSSELKERVQALHDVHIKNSLNNQYLNIAQCHTLLKNAKRIEKEQKEKLNTQLLGVLLAFAYPDRIALQRHAKKGTYLLSNGKGASLHPEDELFNARFLVVSDVAGDNTNAKIYKAIELNRGDIEEYLEEQITTKEVVEWNEEHQRVDVCEVQSLGAIVLKERQIKSASNEEIADVLIAELEALGIEALNWGSEAQNLKERVNFLTHHNIAFLNFSDEWLLENMDEWLAPYLLGINTLKACQNLNLYNILMGLLSFEQRQILDKLAPTQIKVASGSNIAIDYSHKEQPILAVKLQEVLGTKSIPTLLNGKVKVMIHLLSPASRPIQITQDLESFWNNAYEDVRKEMRGKYKRHYWPENPLEAVATKRTKKYM